MKRSEMLRALEAIPGDPDVKMLFLAEGVGAVLQEINAVTDSPNNHCITVSAEPLTAYTNSEG